MTNKNNQSIQFFCPKHGLINRDDVEFWCNHCERNQLIFKDGMYMCPGCFDQANKENFTCAICGKPAKMIETNQRLYA